MGKVFVCGDVHGDLDIAKLNKFARGDGASLTKEDFVVVAGDMGIVWSTDQNSVRELILRDRYEEYPWTTLFIDGNHENFHRLRTEFYPRYESRVEGVVTPITEHVWHLQRGSMYNLHGHNVYCFGGGVSIDADRRTQGVTYWLEELPSFMEMKLGMDVLRKKGESVDYVITHCPPQSVMAQVFATLKLHGGGEHPRSLLEKPFREYLDEVIRMTPNRKGWFFGHMHIDQDYHVDFDVFSGLYNQQPVQLL